MNQLNGHKEFARVVVDNYEQLEEQLQQYADQNRQLLVENGAMAAEINMLRDALTASDRDRLRLQAVASTFGGQARALNSVFNSIIELAIKNGYEAAEQASAKAQAAPQRAEPEKAPETPATRRRAVDPGQGVGAAIGTIDWVADARSEG